MNRRAFTLIEMLAATMLATVLIYAVLVMSAGLSRDRKSLARMNAAPPRAVADLFRWDLVNAQSFTGGAGDRVLVLDGHGGIDRATLEPNGRLVEVTYRLIQSNLWRQQEYLDDPARPDVWRELVAGGVRGVSIEPASAESIPQSAHLRIDIPRGGIDQELVLK